MNPYSFNNFFKRRRRQQEDDDHMEQSFVNQVIMAEAQHDDEPSRPSGSRLASPVSYLQKQQMAEEGEAESKVGEVMEGVASIALLPCGSISGHFIKVNDYTNICYGLHGTELACEKECSRGEDYRLIKLSIIDYNKKKEKVVVVECRGHDAARLNSVDHAHGWDKDVVDMVDEQHGKNKILVSFNCETLKSEKAAEEHISKFLPKLAGLDAVVNIGKMSIAGLDFKAEE